MRRDDQWVRIEQRLPGKATDLGVTAKDNRRLAPDICALLALARERGLGAFGHGNARRCRHGASVARLDPRSYPRAFRRRPKKAKSQEIGRSRGGLTTKLPVAVDALDNPRWVILSVGQIADQGSTRRIHRGRLGLRLGCFYRVHYGTRHSGYHSASLQSAQTSHIR